MTQFMVIAAVINQFNCYQWTQCGLEVETFLKISHKTNYRQDIKGTDHRCAAYWKSETVTDSDQRQLIALRRCGDDTITTCFLRSCDVYCYTRKVSKNMK